jgi:hypothetical protein
MSRFVRIPPRPSSHAAPLSPKTQFITIWNRLKQQEQTREPDEYLDGAPIKPREKRRRSQSTSPEPTHQLRSLSPEPEPEPEPEQPKIKRRRVIPRKEPDPSQPPEEPDQTFTDRRYALMYMFQDAWFWKDPFRYCATVFTLEEMHRVAKDNKLRFWCCWDPHAGSIWSFRRWGQSSEFVKATPEFEQKAIRNMPYDGS